MIIRILFAGGLLYAVAYCHTRYTYPNYPVWGYMERNGQIDDCTKQGSCIHAGEAHADHGSTS
jgi:hypothetical protein